MQRLLVRSSFISLCLCLSIAAAAGDHPKASDAVSVRVYERNADQFFTRRVRSFESAPHVTLKLLIDELGLEQKPLGEGRIGICRGDLCIPFDVADKNGALRRAGNTLWVPVAPLVEALGGHFVWDADMKVLMLDLSDVQRVATWAVGAPFDLRLPDLGGHRVDVVRYRGRKVLIYAWASW